MHIRPTVLTGISLFALPLAAQQRPAAPTPEQRVADSLRAAEARSQVPVVTLGDAITLALRTHPSIVRAGSDLSIAHNSQRVAKASWLPTANVNSTVSKSPSTRFNSATGQVVQVTTPYSGSVGLNANLVLFDAGARIFQGKQAGAQAASADANLVSQKFQVTLLTKQAFFSALAAADLERVALTAVKRAEEQLKIAREKLAAGSAIRSDTLTATVSVGQAQLQVLNAQTQRATQEATLARLIGFDRQVRAVGDSTLIAIVDVDTTTIRTEALQSSPAIAAAQASLRASEAVVNSTKAVYLPRVTASYSNSRSGAAAGLGGAVDFPSLNPLWNLSLGLSWPIFNGLVREQNLWNANANRDAAEASAADARRNVNAQITQWLAALQSARTQYSIAQASREAANESLRIQQERYRLGAATIVEVLQAQQNVDQSEVDAVNARVNYQVARAQLEALLGRSL
ncbi:MAG: TolC family protein [Gemmatimonadetes bacterium]|nr:TolC family protein [Gemmatimonadota bacterium]